MFFRHKHSKSSKNPVLQLVENRRVGPTVRQHIIVSLGTQFPLPKDLWKPVAKAVKQKLRGQITFFDNHQIEELSDRVVKKIETDGKWDSTRKSVTEFKDTLDDQAVAKVYINQVKHTYNRQLGNVLIGHHFWHGLGFPEILSQCNFSNNQIKTAEISVLNRLIAGDSEYGIPSWIKITATEDIIIERSEEYAEDRFYRIADKLLENKEKIESSLYKNESDLFNLTNVVFLYDLTNTYFEGICAKNPKAEYSKNQKEKRTDCPQIVIALVLDEKGFIRKHFVFNGKMSDSKSLEKIINRLEYDFEDSQIPTIIMDRGVVSKKNIELLKSRNLSYIVASRSNEAKQFSEEFGDEDFSILTSDQNNKVEIKLKEDGDDRYLLCKSSGRRRKEVAMRNRAETRLEQDLERLKKLVDQGRRSDPKKIERAIGRIRERHRRVSHYYEIDYTPFTFDYQVSSEAELPKRLLNSLAVRKEKSDNFTYGYVRLTSELEKLQKKYPDAFSEVEITVTKPELTWHIEGEKSGKLSGLDGNYLLKTNRTDLAKAEIWDTYILLTRVEKAFRNLKSDLALRPNYHHLEHRVDSHVFISILAYHLLHSIEYILRSKGITTSWTRINRMMRTHVYATVIMPTKAGPVVHSRSPSIPEANHKEIYDKLGIDYTRLPVTKTWA